MKGVAAALWLVLALAACFGLALIYKSGHDRTGELAAIELRAWALQQRDSVGGLPAEKAVKVANVFGLLPGPSVNYQRIGADCIVYYNEWPFGPKRCIACASDEWETLSS